MERAGADRARFSDTGQTNQYRGGRNIRRDLIKTPSRRHFESKRTSKTGSTSKIGSRNGFVRFGNFCMFRSLSPNGVLNSGHKLTVTYYGEITIEPFLNPEFDIDHDFGQKRVFSVTIPEISRDFRLLHWEGVAQ